jgi:hypothetical protein
MPTLENADRNAGRSALPSTSKRRQAKPTQGMKAFDFTCRYYLKMSGAEFLEGYRSGNFDGSMDTGV